MAVTDSWRWLPPPRLAGCGAHRLHRLQPAAILQKPGYFRQLLKSIPYTSNLAGILHPVLQGYQFCRLPKFSIKLAHNFVLQLRRAVGFILIVTVVKIYHLEF